MRRGALPRLRFWQSVAAVGTFALVLLVAGAGPAAAHGVGGVGASSYASTVVGVVEGAGDLDAGRAAVDVPGVSWRVIGAQDYLVVRNDTDVEVVVLGYASEPYLRVGPDGVFENQRSRTTWLNRDRYASLRGLALPGDLDNAAPPRWEQVSSSTTHAWFDHRAQWMDPDGRPDEVAADPSVERVVSDWEVAFTYAGRDLAVTGELRWVPPPSAVPALGVGLLLVLVPTALASLLRRRTRLPLRVTSVTVGVLAVAALAFEIDGVLASRPVATGLEIGLTLVQALAVVAVAAVAVRQARGGGDARLPVLFAAVAVTAVFAVPETSLLTASVLPGVIGDAAGRTLVAAALLVVVPAVLAVLVARPAAGPDVVGP